jgi:hypothetical protein
MVCCRRGSIAPMLRACRMIDTKIIELIKAKNPTMEKMRHPA